LGFFVVGGVKVEPEGLLMFSSAGDPVYEFNCLVSYNFLSEGKGFPFLLVGYGISNTVPFLNIPLEAPGFSVGVFNAGGGVKFFVKEDVAFRLEYRFHKFSGERTGFSYYPFTVDQKISSQLYNVEFGFSILL